MNTNNFLEHALYFFKEAACVSLSSLPLYGIGKVIFSQSKHRAVDTLLFLVIKKTILQEVLVRGVVQPTIKHYQNRFYTWYRKREATHVELKCQKRFRIITTVICGTILDGPLGNMSILNKIYILFFTTLREISYSEIRESTGSIAPTILIKGLRSIGGIGYSLNEISSFSQFLLNENFPYIVDSLSTKKSEKGIKNILLSSVHILFLDRITKGVFKNFPNFNTIYDAVFAGPVREEITHRYFFHKQMKKTQKAFFLTFYPKEAPSPEEKEAQKGFRIFTGAIIFGGCHATNKHSSFYLKAFQVFNCAFSGVSYGRLFETHKSLLPSISAHFINNFTLECNQKKYISLISTIAFITFKESFLYNYSSKNFGEIKEDIKGKIQYSAKKLKEYSLYLGKKGLRVALFSLPLLLIMGLADKEHYKVRA